MAGEFYIQDQSGDRDLWACYVDYPGDSLFNGGVYRGEGSGGEPGEVYAVGMRGY